MRMVNISGVLVEELISVQGGLCGGVQQSVQDAYPGYPMLENSFP